MHARLCALSLLIAGFLLTDPQAARGLIAAPGSASLVPATLAGLRPGAHWRNRLYGNAFEEGALYAPPDGGAPVQFDLFRNHARPHNGIVCYLKRGEWLRSEQLLRLRTAGGTEAQFDLAVLSDGERLRVMATTECSAGGCVEEPARSTSDAAGSLHFGELALERRRPVIPLSISVQGTADDAATAARLDAELRAVILQLDLSPLLRAAQSS